MTARKGKEKAYERLLSSDPQGLKEGKVLLCQLAFEKGNFKLVAQHAHDIYEIQPTFDVALMNANAFALLEDPDSSGGWLETAALFGEKEKESVKEVVRGEIFNRVRDHEAFRAYMEKLFPEENLSHMTD